MRSLATVLCLVALPLHARADEPKSQRSKIEAVAQGHWDNGRLFYEAGDYAQAVIEWDAGYKLTGNTLFGFNLAFAYLKLGQRDNAIKSATPYCLTAPEDKETVPCQLLAQRPPTTSSQTVGGSGATPLFRPRQKAALVLSVGGAAFVVAGAGLAGYGAAVKAQYQEAARNHADYAAVGLPLADRYRASSTAGVILLTVGGLSLGSSIVLWAVRNAK